MSTQYDLGHGLCLDERGSHFDIEFSDQSEDHISIQLAGGLRAEQIIRLALALLQPVLYNVKDPKTIKAEILRQVGELWA